MQFPPLSIVNKLAQSMPLIGKKKPNHDAPTGPDGIPILQETPKQLFARQLEGFEKTCFERKPGAAARDFFEIVHERFGQLFHMRFEFTYEELAAEISRHRIEGTLKKKLIDYVTKLIELEYSDTPLSCQDLSALSVELRGIIGALNE